MKFQKTGLFLILLGAFAVLGTGCEPYHRGGVGIDVDIHSKDYHKDDRDHHRDHQDDRHRDGDDHQDEDQ